MAALTLSAGFRGICTPDAQFKLTCPGPKTFFTGAVFWGVLGPSRLFGAGKRYNLLLLGFPIGIMIPIGEIGLLPAKTDFSALPPEASTP